MMMMMINVGMEEENGVTLTEGGRLNQALCFAIPKPFVD